MIDKNLGKYCTLAEAIKSQAAINNNVDNTPTEEHFINMKAVYINCFEPLREHFNTPIGISSFYRSPKLNKIIKGSKTSAHMEGCAIDIDGDIFGKPSNSEIFHWLKDNVEFDQLIWEGNSTTNPNWVHVSYKTNGNRKQVLKASFDATGKPSYTNY